MPQNLHACHRRDSQGQLALTPEGGTMDRRLPHALAVIAFAFVLAPPAQAGATIDWAQWRQLTPNEQVVYMVGVVDTWYNVMRMINTGRTQDPPWDMDTLRKSLADPWTCYGNFVLSEGSEELKAGRLLEVIDGFVRDHPEYSDLRKGEMSGIIWTAIFDWCKELNLQKESK